MNPLSFSYNYSMVHEIPKCRIEAIWQADVVQMMQCILVIGHSCPEGPMQSLIMELPCKRAFSSPGIYPQVKIGFVLFWQTVARGALDCFLGKLSSKHTQQSSSTIPPIIPLFEEKEKDQRDKQSVCSLNEICRYTYEEMHTYGEDCLTLNPELTLRREMGLWWWVSQVL